MAGILGQSINVAQGLQGLALGRMQEQQMQQEQEKTRLAGEALKRYQDTSASGAPDMGALNVAILNSPDMAMKFQQATGLQDRIQKQDAAQFAINAAKVLDSPDEFRRLAQERIARIQARGGNPEQTVGMLQAYEQGNKDQVKNGLTGVAASLVATGDLKPDAYEIAFGPAPASLTEYQKANLELDKQRLGLEERRLSAMTQAGGPSGGGTSTQKDWNTYQELLKTDPERAKAFGRAAGFQSKEGQQLTGFSEKQIATASDEYSSATAAAGRYSALADQIRKKSIGGGLASTWAETLKDLSGNQDEITQLKRSVLEVVNSEAIKALPPGPATDRDIALVREPFPTARANGEYIANWLGAVARLNEKRAQYAEHKANFIAQNGGQRNEQGETVLSSWKRIQSEQTPTDTGQLFKDADAIIGGQ